MIRHHRCRGSLVVGMTLCWLLLPSVNWLKFCAFPLLVSFVLVRSYLSGYFLGVFCWVCSLLVAGWVQAVVSWFSCFSCRLLLGLASCCFLGVFLGFACCWLRPFWNGWLWSLGFAAFSAGCYQSLLLVPCWFVGPFFGQGSLFPSLLLFLALLFVLLCWSLPVGLVRLLDLWFTTGSCSLCFQGVCSLFLHMHVQLTGWSPAMLHFFIYIFLTFDEKKKTKWWRKWTHKIYTSAVKDLNNKNRI